MFYNTDFVEFIIVETTYYMDKKIILKIFFSMLMLRKERDPTTIPSPVSVRWLI